MRPAAAPRVAVLAAIALLAITATASADTAPAGADFVTPGYRDLGEVAPGAVIDVALNISLKCSGFYHVDSGQTTTLEPDSYTIPLGGDLSATGATIGPPPSGWPADGYGCPVPAPASISASQPSTVTIMAPMSPGGPYSYTIFYKRSLSPAGAYDSNSISGSTVVTFDLTVVANTPPTLNLPADSTVEGDTAGGAAALYTVTATDAEDDPDPAPTCAPAFGALLPPGENVIECSVTDSGGLGANGSFRITVVDTTPPAFVAPLPNLTAQATDSAGAVVSWPAPQVVDLVDPSPGVDCLPASGSAFPTGTTTVSCTATDASLNAANAKFTVTVQEPGQAGAVFAPPIAPALDLRATRGRMVPVRVELFQDGSALRTGSAALMVFPCGGSGPTSGPLWLRWQPDAGRWFGLLDTSSLAEGSCSRVSVTVDGHEMGSFTLRIDRPRGQ